MTLLQHQSIDFLLYLKVVFSEPGIKATRAREKESPAAMKYGLRRRLHAP
jgi:hypothetical protein